MTSPTALLRRRKAHRDERGSVSIQMVFLMPALFAVMFLGLQAALFYHARSVAIAAAQEGAREAGSEFGSKENGVQVANDFLSDAGGDDVLTSTSVSGSRTTTTATVTVTGLSLSVVPGWHVRVTQSASVPVERLTPTSGGFAISEGGRRGN
jgi:Flp pilus assembly protein TadG